MKRFRLTMLLAAVCGWVGFTGPESRAADWPQWRGPARNGISSEKGFRTRWSASGPKKLWTASVGTGYSAVAVVKGRVYTLGNDGSKDTVYCLNADTGKTVWRHTYSCRPGNYKGPRATPVVENGRVYTLSREGHAKCLDANRGKVIWEKNLVSLTGAKPPQWGFAGSPLILGDRLIYNVGDAGAALRKSSGALLWKSKPGKAGYSSPVAFSLGGKQGVALFTAYGLVAVNPSNGAKLWSYRWETKYDVNAADPIFIGSSVFISSNYNKGAALLRISGSRLSPVWQNRYMRNHFNMCVLVNGYLFGNDQNTLKCISSKTGKETWQQRGMGKGGIIAADGKLIYTTERGDLVIAQATSSKYTELARAKVMSKGKCWTHPVLANGRVYCRTDAGQLVCVQL